MSRYLATIVSFICFPSLADMSQPEAEHFHPKVPIVWAAANKLSSSVEVYETVQTNFSISVLSNAMVMGSFKPIDMTSQSKDMITFEARRNNVLVRSLKISQSQGTIDYFKMQTNWSAIHGVPSFDDAKRLAIDYLQRFGADTNQISLRPSPRIEQTVKSYDRKGGTMTNKAVSARGIMLRRAIDGVDCSDSLLIQFGNDATVSILKMNWRYLKPHQRVKPLSKKEIMETIKAGNAVVVPNPIGGDFPDDAKSFTITKATPIYSLLNVGPLVSPSVDFEVISDIGTPSATTNYIECPFVRDSK